MNLEQVAVALLCIVERDTGISELQRLPPLPSVFRHRQRLKTKKSPLQNFSPRRGARLPSSHRWLPPLPPGDHNDRWPCNSAWICFRAPVHGHNGIFIFPPRARHSVQSRLDVYRDDDFRAVTIADEHADLTENATHRVAY